MVGHQDGSGTVPSPLRASLNALSGTPFNTALANLYRDGLDSVSWHADDEPDLGPEPVIASVSLGAPRRFLLRKKRDPSTRHELELTHGSVVVMSGSTQHSGSIACRSRHVPWVRE